MDFRSVALMPLTQQASAYFEAVVRGLEAPRWSDLGAGARYTVLRDLYFSNGTYDYVATDSNDPAIRPLRNPVFRAVEFYADTLWPGQYGRDIRLTHNNTRLEEPLERLLRWSNWPTRKQQFARWFPLYGDGFLKVEQKSDGSKRPYVRVLDPTYVTDFDLDERGYVTYARVDIPAAERNTSTGALSEYTYTEVWYKGHVRTWHHRGDSNVSIPRLGNPKTTSHLPFDFVPLVHVPFISAEEKYGMSCVAQSLDKVHEANRQATTLAARLYRYGKPDMVLEGSGQDSLGRPLPPPAISSDGTLQTDEVFLGEERLWSLPAGWRLSHIVAPVNYSAALQLLNSQIDELAEDLPELAYSKVWQLGEISGKALRYKLMPAISRATEARGNGEVGIIRALQMALTIGQLAKIDLFHNIGKYDTGDFAMEFATREVIPSSPEERLALFQGYTAAGIPLELSLTWSGHSDEQVEQAASAIEAEGEKQVALQEQALELQARAQEQQTQIDTVKVDHQAVVNQQVSDGS